MNLTGTDIVKLLETNDKAICRALVVLYERQTADEKATKDSRHDNNRGFRPCHAKMGTSMAEFYLKRGFLSPKQIAYWRKRGKEGMRISIYWRQLLDAAHKKAAAKVASEQRKEVERNQQVAARAWRDRVEEKADFARIEAEAEQASFNWQMKSLA